MMILDVRNQWHVAAVMPVLLSPGAALTKIQIPRQLAIFRQGDVSFQSSRFRVKKIHAIDARLFWALFRSRSAKDAVGEWSVRYR